MGAFTLYVSFHFLSLWIPYHISELVADESVSLTFAYLSKPVISEIPVL